MPLEIKTPSDLLSDLMMRKGTGESVNVEQSIKENDIDRVAFLDELKARLEYWRKSLKRVLSSEGIVMNFEANKGVHEITIGMLEGFERQLNNEEYET